MASAFGYQAVGIIPRRVPDCAASTAMALIPPQATYRVFRSARVPKRLARCPELAPQMVRVGRCGSQPHAEDSLRLYEETLRRYPADRILRPVMNSIRADIELNPYQAVAEKQAAKPVPIDQRPLDNEYAWKGNAYAVDGCLKPTVTALQFSCDDPLVMQFSDSSGART